MKNWFGKKKNVKGVWVRETWIQKEKKMKKRVKNKNKITNLGEVRHGFKKNEINNEKNKIK